jgi:hypothetical protein
MNIPDENNIVKNCIIFLSIGTFNANSIITNSVYGILIIAVHFLEVPISWLQLLHLTVFAGDKNLRFIILIVFSPQFGHFLNITPPK